MGPSIRTMIVWSLLGVGVVSAAVDPVDVEAMRTAITDARVAERRDRPAEARAHLERAVEIARSRLDETIHEANAIDELAFADLLAGRYELAIQGLVESLEMYRRLLHGDQPRVATSLHNLAVAEARASRPSEAETHALEALALWDRLPPARAAGREDTLRLLAKLARRDGRPEDAARFERRLKDTRR